MSKELNGCVMDCYSRPKGGWSATVHFEREVTDAMVDAYLKANDAYWRETDAQPKSPARWRNGNVKEATRVSLIAAMKQGVGYEP